MSRANDPDTLEGIILAGGRSRRAGTFKPALPIRGKAMVLTALEGMLAVCERVIVVGGHEHARLSSIVSGQERVECIENPRHAFGMFTSVKAGIAGITARRCFVLPVDTPLVPPGVYRALAAVEAPIVVPRYCGRRGHPVLLARGVFPRLLAAPDSSSLRTFIHETGFAALDVAAGEILMDLDTPDDIRHLTEELSGHQQ